MLCSAFLSNLSALVALAAFVAPLVPVAAESGMPDGETLLPGEFDPGKALDLVYGKLEMTGEAARWKPSEGEVRKALADSVQVRVLAVLPFRQDGADRIFLVAQLVPEGDRAFDCHSCAPGIGAATFTKAAEGWRLDTRSPYISDLGSFGAVPKPEIVKMGPERSGFAFQTTYHGQGQVEVTRTYFLEAGASVTEALDVGVRSDNSGACGSEEEGFRACYAFDSTVEFVPGEDAEYFDVKVTTTAEHDDQFREETLYSYADGTYRKTSP